MTKGWIFAISATVMLSGCGSFAGSGALTGASLGSMLGSAIGGIGGGWRGSNVGTVVGMAAGAVVGGAVGSSADKKMEEQYAPVQRELSPEERAELRKRNREIQQNKSQNGDYQDDEVIVNTENTGDDRIYNFGGDDYNGDYSAQEPTVNMPETSSVDNLTDDYTYGEDVVIVNPRFVDGNQDNVINRGEVSKVIFEVMNRGNSSISDVQPTVMETTGNKHIFISPGMHIEQILPGKGIRYTAIVKADNRIKDGNIGIAISVVHGNKTISKVTEFNIQTRK